MQRYTIYDNGFTAIETYKQILNGTRKRFPSGFWQPPEGRDNAIQCTRYLFDEILKWDESTIKSNATSEVFADNKLMGMILLLYNSSNVKAIIDAYPNINVWELACVSKYYWHEFNNRKLAFNWLLNKLSLDIDGFIRMYTTDTFLDNGLNGLLHHYNGSIGDLILDLYKYKYKIWELKHVPTNFWKNKDNCRESIRWLLEDKLKYSDKEICKNFNSSFLHKHRLATILVTFNYKTFDIINYVYPERFKPWDFNQCEKGFWLIKNNRIDAINWIMEKYNISDVEKLINKHFRDNGLRNMLIIGYGSDMNKLYNEYENK